MINKIEEVICQGGREEEHAGSGDQAEENKDGEEGQRRKGFGSGSEEEQMGHDKLTAIWRRASSLLASFDDELA